MSWPACPICPVWADLSGLTCLADLSGWHDPADLFRITCPFCFVLTVPPRSPIPAVLTRLSCNGCPTKACLPQFCVQMSCLVILFWPSCPLCHVQAETGWPVRMDLSGWTCPDGPDQTFLSRMTCPSCTVMAALPQLSCQCCHVLSRPVLSLLYCPDCPIWESCPGSLACAALAFLSKLPCPSPIVPSAPVTAVGLCCHVLTILSCPGCQCHALTVLSQLSRTSCPALSVLFWLALTVLTVPVCPELWKLGY